MMGSKNPAEDGVELKELLNNNEKLEQGLPHSASGQKTYSCSTHSRMSKSSADQQNVENGLRQRALCDCQRFTQSDTDGDKAKPVKKFDCTSKIAIILAFVLILSVCGNVVQYVTASPRIMPCPPNWIMTGEMCYFFSDTQGMWNFSQNNCSSYGGSLVTIRSQQEWALLIQCRRPTEYWINLQRKKQEEPWKWPNGSFVDSWLQIGGTGLCAYLNEKAASSTLCDNERNWICSKPANI